MFNQKAVIAAYAVTNNLTIVRSYEDAGRSGLSAEGRQSLMRLVDDVVNGDPGFDTVLVYDVSRWVSGRRTINTSRDGPSNHIWRKPILS